MSNPPPIRALRPAFTLIEVLVASGLLALFSAGLVATTWRMMAFAEDEAEHMAADAYCHDVMWAVFSQSYSNIASVASFPIDAEHGLPRVVSKDIFGRESTVYPLWRSQERSKRPTCAISASGDGEREISVTVSWYKRDGVLATHTMTVNRADVRRSE